MVKQYSCKIEIIGYTYTFTHVFDLVMHDDVGTPTVLIKGYRGNKTYQRILPIIDLISIELEEE